MYEIIQERDFMNFGFAVAELMDLLIVRHFIVVVMSESVKNMFYNEKHIKKLYLI